jgi:hypothetical protein
MTVVIKKQTIDAILEEIGLESIIPEHVTYKDNSNPKTGLFTEDA